VGGGAAGRGGTKLSPAFAFKASVLRGGPGDWGVGTWRDVLRAPVFRVEAGALRDAPEWMSHLDWVSQVRVPFPRIIVEYEQDPGVVVGIHGRAGGWQSAVYSLADDGAWDLGEAILWWEPGEETVQWWYPGPEDRATGDELGKAFVRRWGATVMATIHTVDLMGRHRPAVLPEVVPASRRPLSARGIPPEGWRFSTVRLGDLPPEPARPGPPGGTHASPRWHLRRGHWRTCPSGKLGWVRDCEVGDKARGGVVSSYEVRR
jgi:hypothetical protein